MGAKWWISTQRSLWANWKIKTLTKDLNIPWFAIGGIKSNNISYLKRNGFKKVALVSQLMNSDDPREEAIMII